MSKWQWILQQFSRKLWVRTSMFCVLAVITAFAALVLKDYIPENTSQQIGADSVDSILNIIASSMLTVTTFSLSIMVAAYSAATTNVTPRSTQLLLADNTSHNALSVFIGSFIFSIVSIVALTMGVYGDSGRLVLFGVTIAVIIIIIGVMIRWINYLSHLGRVTETIDMVERKTAQAFQYRLKEPHLGCNPLHSLPPNLHAVTDESIGYVQHIDFELLQELAEEQDCAVYLDCSPGDFCNGVRPLAYISKALKQKERNEIASAFSIGGDRSFDQDPRFGLVVLSEIASRALSPAVNDPGTAIDVVGTGLRVLMPWLRQEAAEREVEYPNLYAKPLVFGEFLDDLFLPIARDGAAFVEVCLYLQKALSALHDVSDPELQTVIRKHAELAFKRATTALTLEEDKERLAKSSLIGARGN